MKRWLTGERILAAAFGVMAVLFAAKAGDLKYMDEFAPGAGFLPFWLGMILAALVVVFLLSARATAAEEKAAASRAPRKVFAVSAGLVACVALIETLGFALGIAAFVVYLVRWIERRSWVSAIGLAAGTALMLYLIFRAWLSVPLPQGPWGF